MVKAAFGNVTADCK